MSSFTPLKMSAFSSKTTLSTGSYFICLDSGSSAIDNTKILATDAVTWIARNRWKSVPANSAATGTDGDEAYDGTYYYLHTGGVWRRTTLGGTF